MSCGDDASNSCDVKPRKKTQGFGSLHKDFSLRLFERLAVSMSGKEGNTMDILNNDGCCGGDSYSCGDTDCGCC